MREFFEYKDGQLYCESVPVKEIVRRFGTPLYIYSKASFLYRFKALKDAFDREGLKPLICYSIKANSNLSVLNTLKKAGAGFDVVSGGEIYRAMQVGGSANKCVYAGVGKRREDIKMALEWGILMFNVESEAELELIDAVAARMKKKARVALRINPDVDARTHDYITTAKKENKFGIDLYTAEQIFARQKQYKNVKIIGIHIHIGSQIVDTRPYAQALKKVERFIKLVSKKYDAGLKYINIGGGLGITYNDEKVDSPEVFAKRVSPYVKRLGLKLIMEPGRFIAGNSGIFVCRVIYVKKTPAKNFVIVDGAMNDLIRPSLYKAYHRIWPVAPVSQEEFVCDVVGPVCESGDFFAKDRRLPIVGPGELLAVFSAGAYGFVMASNYNSRPLPAEVLVDGDKVHLVRRRQGYRDMLRLERVI